MTKSTQARLLRAARAASAKAYAPFSNLKVGAAVLTTRGRIFSGCNVENSSYGLTICAERVAVYKAVSAGQRKVKAVLVYADTAKLTPPCGACLQVITESAENAEIVLSNGSSTKTYRLRQLLPHGFRLTPSARHSEQA
jgi:cytidine deaminase